MVLAALAAGAGYGFVGAPAAMAVDDCLNAAVRAQQGVQDLPNCRAYEQVTPKVKNGAAWKTGVDALSAGEATVLSFDGNRLLATATMAFPSEDIGALNLNGTFVLERKKHGWVDLYVSPAPRPILPGQNPTQNNPRVIGQSHDLSLLNVSTANSFSERDADGSRTDNYALRLDGGPSSDQLSSLSAPRLLSCPDDPAPPCSGTATTGVPSASGATDSTVSDDGSTVLFETDEGMGVPGAVGPQIYARTGPSLNEVRWVSQPLASVPAGATQVAGAPTAMAANSLVPAVPSSSPLAWDNALAPDGSHVFFASPATGQSRIYVRQNHATTLEVSRVRGGSTTAAPVSFRGASEDGNRALIETPQALLPPAGPAPALTSPNTVNDLYLWTHRPGGVGDEAPDALVRVTGLEQVGPGPILEGQTALSVVGQSDDLSVFYFVTKTTHASGQASGLTYPQQANLYRAVIDAAEPAASTVQFVATTAMSVVNDFTQVGSCLNAGSKGTTCARTSSDGRYLTFDSSLPLTADDTEQGCATSSGGTLTPGVARMPGEPDTVPAGCRSDVFLFDNTEGTLVRVSRGSDPEHDNGPYESSLRIASKQAVRVLDDGSAVFFVSTERLVANDVNDKQDVYEWNRDEASGRVALISGGSGTHHAQLLTASADGGRVFFISADGLVSDDTDTSSDIYTAVRNGGFLATEPSVCEEVVCERPSVQVPTPPLAGSSVFSGPGNLDLSRRLAKPVKPSVGGPRVTIGTTIELRVKAPGRGRLRVAGSGLRLATKTTTRAATYQVRVRLSRRATRALRRKHRVSVTARVIFVAKGGRAATRRVKLTFRSGQNHREAGRANPTPVRATNGAGR